MDGRSEGEITGGPDVRAAQRTQEINVSGPTADALESDEHFVRGIIREVVKIPQIEVTAREGLGEQSRVESLLAAEADA